MSERSYDIVVFGATGFTGGLVAEYLAKRYGSSGLRWAIAGRSAGKLADVKRRVVAVNADCKDVAEIVASIDDDKALRRMAHDTRVVLTTVGPYARYGEPVVKACVEEGTDYCDITGEPEFVDAMIERYDEAARDKGVRIVNCCGFDSIPHDLGALFTVEQLPEDEPITVEGFVRSSGTFSGGTWTSAVEAMSRFREYQAKQKSKKREPRGDRRVGSTSSTPRFEGELGAWVAPLPTIDPQVVRRSARALERYGPDFRYGHFVRVKSLPKLIAGAAAVGSIFALAQIPTTKRWLLNVRRPGEGPTEEQRAKARFEVEFHGESRTKTVVTRVRGGDPGYGETSKMIAESALCLALDGDKTPESAGVVTTAQAMGDVLIDRLRESGIQFDVLPSG